ncbi:BCCT family transporter [Ruania alkalisoli]|uniref:BCCT family transporter n=1 Tax=Ruania alkalisoli TaxID=2779775 RepID=A0A7M1SP66_9MICO|nr:BCCT family transporter [Ruania alkalisoli]QOR69338.1 BCCT family transporter [Ruania alkalisoli]
MASSEIRTDVAGRDIPQLGSVFGASLSFALAFIVFGLVFPATLQDGLSALQRVVVTTFGPVYVGAVAVVLVLMLAVALSPVGRLQLGKPGRRPEFGWPSWLAMLMSAGVGLSFLFWGTAQPLLHAVDPPPGTAQAGTAEAAAMGLRYSLFFWGPHAWALYAGVAVPVAYAAFRKDRPVLISSALYALMGESTRRWPGKIIDLLAVIAILFGVATSLGLGTRELNEGLAHAFGVPISYGAKVAIIVGLMTVSTISAMTGLGRGIRWLSLANGVLCSALVVFTFFWGPTRDLIGDLGTMVGGFVTHLPGMSLATETPGNSWEAGWTFFFWAWWIAWAPFVGTFIARISRGRTIRSVVAGVVLVPGSISAVWFSVFGGTALNRVESGTVDPSLVAGNVKSALTVEVFGTLPLPGVVAVVVAIVLALLFITSADSASFMLGSTTSGGSLKPPRPVRLLWSFSAAFAAVLLLAGGVSALQGAAVVAAVPFTVILLAVCVSFVLMVVRDLRRPGGPWLESSSGPSPGQRAGPR